MFLKTTVIHWLLSHTAFSPDSRWRYQVTLFEGVVRRLRVEKLAVEIDQLNSTNTCSV